MIVRTVERDDISSFVEVYTKAYEGLEEYAYTRRREIRNYFKWLFSRDRDGFMVAEVDGEVVGFVACDTNWISVFERQKVGEIHELFILPEWRCRGIGSVLLGRAIEYSKSRGRRIAELWAGRTNYRARRFYSSHGFREAGEWGKWIRMIRDL
ncbi:GNAT family N-acetyltransferase [Archaeoglobus neptunius]|uniref:GNAT family N-acetyltransferase n=1 Tax=Archaeoglobus neptunius TaxID=2798580 RepID=UPI00192667E2